MNVLKVRDDIFIVENFYKNYTQFYNFILENEDKYEVRVDKIKSFNILNDGSISDNKILDLCTDYIFHLEEAVENITNFSLLTKGNFIMNFFIYEIGTYIPSHTDTYDTHNEDSPHVWSTVHYLNDDFFGGEIVFLDINLEIKPLKNMLLIFNSNYLHKTKEIKSGKKICATRFWKGNKNNNG